MKHLDRLAARLEAHLDRKDQLREQAIALSRRILRASTGAVRAMHQGERPGPAVREAARDAARLARLLRGHDDVYNSGFVEEALQELAEAGLVLAILEREPLPEPEDMHCPPVPYLLGLGDAIGELRRAILDAIRRDDWREAERLLAWMDALFDALMRFDQAVASPVRRKQDVARSLIEKTRGELTVIQRGRTLERSITGILDEVEQRERRKAKAPAKDLDLDAESDYRGKGGGKPAKGA